MPLKPFLSVAIPVFNRRHLCPKAVQSVLAQNIDDLEILVVDNASTDGTWEVLQTFKDSRLRLIRNPTNLGMFGNFNRCVELSRGEWLRILCSDDALTPNGLSEELRLLRCVSPESIVFNSAGSAISGGGEEIAPLGKLLAPGEYSSAQAVRLLLAGLALFGANPLNFPSGIFFRREAAVAAGGFDLSFRHCADVDLWLRLLSRGSLTNSGVDACRVLTHSGQASCELAPEGHSLSELRLLVNRHRVDLGTKAALLHRRFESAIRARGLYHLLKFAAHGRIGSVKAYASNVCFGLRPVEDFISLSSLCWRRFRRSDDWQRVALAG